MKTLDQWFAEYAESHRHPVNKRIHNICVPLIFFSIIGFLMSIPRGFLAEAHFRGSSLLLNWATILMVFVIIYYARLSIAVAWRMSIFTVSCIVAGHYLDLVAPLWLISLIIFVLAWAGQFYGHHVEGKKPSFFKDLQFLLIGPLWVMRNLFPFKMKN